MLVHELGARKNARASFASRERAVQVVDERLLWAITVHHSALGRDDPFLFWRLKEDQVGLGLFEPLFVVGVFLLGLLTDPLHVGFPVLLLLLLRFDLLSVLFSRLFLPL